MSSLYSLQEYTGEEDFIIAMDIGTTQSAVSFVHLVPGTTPQCKMVNHWPGQAQSRNAAKVPSAVSYRAGVLRNCGEAAIQDLEAGNLDVAQWFKLHIHPLTMARPSSFVIPALPPGVSIERAYMDMMKYLMNITQRFFERTTPDGNRIWTKLRDRMTIVLTTPNGWEDQEQAIIRTAAVRAGIVNWENVWQRLCFMAEAEAAVHYALKYYPQDWLERDTVFSVVDAGGSTVDITVYRCVLAQPLSITEVCPGECAQAGGIFVNREVERLLSERLQGSPYDDPVIIRDMLDFFERKLKPVFDGNQSEYHIRFGGSTDTDESLRISKGIITLSLQELKVAFDKAVNPIIACCTNALKGHMPKYILLIGGFGESPYLRQALEGSFRGAGVRVIGVGDYSRKAAAEGAIIGFTKLLVTTRTAKVTIGGCVRELYNSKIHGARRHCTYTDADGKRRINNVFHPWVTKGMNINEDFVRRLHYHNSWRADATTESSLGVQLGRINAEVYAWERIGSAPIWCKDEKGHDMPGMRLMCTLDVDLSVLASSLQIRSGSQDTRLYRVDYDICVYFRGTDLRASLEWREGNQIRRASIPTIDPNKHWW